jgi:23S rRNA pseudouridine2605 synthase
VGRLDIDTTGLIIVTNDNELTNRLTHPSFKISKTYVAVVKGRITPAQIEKLKKGVWLDKGKTAGSSVKILKKTRDESTIEMTIRQGMNRQVRRMLARVDLPVKSLKRTKIGKIDAKGIGIGKYRALSKAQIDYLKRATSAS